MPEAGGLRKGNDVKNGIGSGTRCAWLVAGLLAGGCSGEKRPDPPPAKNAAPETPAAPATGADVRERALANFGGNFMAGVDGNGDGRVSKAEYAAIWKDKNLAAGKFKQIDRNGDGFLTPEEFLPAAARGRRE